MDYCNRYSYWSFSKSWVTHVQAIGLKNTVVPVG